MTSFTKREIKSSFVQLLSEQPLNKISVKDIVERCGINRNSFYYHFRDIPSLIEEIMLEEVESIVEKYPTIDELDACVDSIIAVCIEHRKALLNIFRSVNRDIFEKYIMSLCETVVTKYVSTMFGHRMKNDRDREICIWSLKCELFGMLIDWCIKGLKEEDAKSIHRLIELLQGIPNIIISQSNEDSIKESKI